MKIVERAADHVKIDMHQGAAGRGEGGLHSMMWFTQDKLNEAWNKKRLRK